ncbi:hypothetical protein [uncultured Mucilaginibacter sp.]|uniref:hypothetical protein n=1 Tax=uncultured Mucilaginibacter sp. TaxID=797541 RepID=UPI002623574A|nr:hypothetical protein [uncultured Mucilaginibacter sp.]
MKKIAAFTSILFLCSKISFAQLSYNFSNYSVGIGGGIVRADADLAQHTTKEAIFGTLNYNYSPYITITGELQAGKLAGGNPQTDKDTRAFVNNYKAAILYGDIQAGEFIDYQYRDLLNILKNIYVGTGIGVIHNSMAFVQRVSLNNPGYVFPGENSSTELMVPLRIGYELKFFNYYQEPHIRLNFGYQMNWVYGEGLDGYNDPPSMFRNNHVDRYSMISIGVKYNFGNPVSYKKPIGRF